MKLLGIALVLCGFLLMLLIQAFIPTFWGHLAEPSSWTYAGLVKSFTSAVVFLGPFLIAAICLCKSEKATKRLF